MAKSKDGRRIAYDRIWGALLVATLFLPAAEGETVLARHPFPSGRPWAEILWLTLGSVTGLVAFLQGWSGARGRRRHLVNFALAAVTLALPIFSTSIWMNHPDANPARLPLGDFGSVGWVVMLALLSVYAGSGVRVARPSQYLGQALAGLGAILLVLFTCLPPGGGEPSLVWARIILIPEAPSHLSSVIPFGLAALACLAATLNLVRTRAEVFLARLTRLLLAGSLLAWIAFPLVENGFGEAQLPVVWGALRMVAPLFLALDACIAYLAISITRGND